MSAQSLQDQLRLIEELDLTKVRERYLCDPNWLCSEESCNQAEWRYRQFLKGFLAHPNEAVRPPDPEVTRFWIEHILDTERYIADCERIFSKVIHHIPYQPNESDIQQAQQKGTEHAAHVERIREDFD